MNELTVVLLSIAGTLLIVLVGVALRLAWKKMSLIASAINKYISTEQAGGNPAGLATIPSLIEGLTKMCAAQVVAINDLRKTVKSLQEAIFKRDDIRGLETPDDDVKNIAWEAKRIQAENPGMDYMSAMMRAVEEEAKETNGAAGVGEFHL